MGGLDKPQFYQWLWGEAKRALAEQGEAGDRADSISGFREFREAVMAAGNKGYKLVFFLDEFETIATNSHLDQDAFNDLRSLARTVVYVTASQDRLSDLSYPHRDILSSPFFNVFGEIYLGFLTPEEAEEMISGLLGMAEQEDLFTEQDLTFVFEIASYHPFFLQLACYHLFDRKMERGKLAAEDYGVVRRQYAESARSFFRYIWNHLKEGEQGAVRLVCEGKADQIRDEQRRRLERECLLYNGAIFSSVFAEFVREQVTVAGWGEEYKGGAEKKSKGKAGVEVAVRSGEFVTLDALLTASFFGGVLIIVLALLASYAPLFWLAGFLALVSIVLLLVRLILTRLLQRPVRAKNVNNNR
jgi:hypothetical protein